MSQLARRALLLLALFFLLPTAQGFAQQCGENEPGRAEWTMADGDESLYRAVFSAREGTLVCFELLDDQYDVREAHAFPEGVPEWLGAEGRLNLVSTWDTEFLPYSFQFLALSAGKEVTRTVQQPVASADPVEWQAGEKRSAKAADMYKADPMYTLVHADETEIVYVWPDPQHDQSDLFIEKRYSKLTGYRIRLSVTVYNFGTSEATAQPQINVHSWEVEKKTRGFFSPAPNILEGLCMVGEDDLERENGSSLLEEPLNPPGAAGWTGVGNRYFLLALVSRTLSEPRCALSALANGVVTASLYRSNPVTVEAGTEARCYPSWYRPDTDLLRCAKVAEELELPLIDLFIPSVCEKAYAGKKESLPADRADRILAVIKELGSKQGAAQFSVELYLGPKDIDRLNEAEVGLDEALDFWIVGLLAKPMLYLLRWFHGLVNHWAVAILMLTVLVKLALLYWTQKSFSQMQRMAQLKPMMDGLKEKYGKDKERLNQEMMSLYKREKVNPLGGCLPMLLQMPIWIALYRTIYSSVELYQAPLGGWIQDLSAPDPFFIMPVLLGASMFLQQKMTPTTMDSAQAKMMLYMMPIMFTVFMLFLPSGLTFYILINTFLTMLQQWYLRRKFTVAGSPKTSAGKA